jgi:hypothetical protein
MATAIEAGVDSSLFPDLHCQRYILQTEAALNDNEQNLKKEE